MLGTNTKIHSSDSYVSKPEFNPFNPEFRAHPYPFYDALRTHEPVHTTEFGIVPCGDETCFSKCIECLTHFGNDMDTLTIEVRFVLI